MTLSGNFWIQPRRYNSEENSVHLPMLNTRPTQANCLSEMKPIQATNLGNVHSAEPTTL